LPEDKDQNGTVTVTGTMNGKPVQMTAKVELKGAGAEESFIPRLWARMHLDSLLEQGASESIKDEIIALSEEYNIITPYTSFLVLETDADRERFKVKQRFRMRDGEKFFAEGRDNANYELVQQQMKKAGTWRLGLRRTILQQLASLGRDPRMFRQRSYEERLGTIYAGAATPLIEERIHGQGYLPGGEPSEWGLIDFATLGDKDMVVIGGTLDEYERPFNGMGRLGEPLRYL